MSKIMDQSEPGQYVGLSIREMMEDDLDDAVRELMEDSGDPETVGYVRGMTQAIATLLQPYDPEVATIQVKADAMRRYEAFVARQDQLRCANCGEAGVVHHYDCTSSNL